MSSLRDADVAAMASAATDFLAAQRWCGRVLSAVPVFVVEGVVGAFRCSLVPRQPDADVMVWVVVGDLPSAYLAHEPGDSWQDALRGYIGEMRRWVDAVLDGQAPGADIIPVNAPATRENAALLASRLDFLQARLLDAEPDSVPNDV
jgi:hypothetical protein